MSFALGAALALHVVLQAGQQPPRRQPPTVVRDSSPADSVRPRSPRRVAVTDEHRRTAFRDEHTRELVTRARLARLRQDSALTSYDANVRQRMTAKMEIGKLGPERVMYRQESAFRVQWSLAVGARVELTGARVGIPMAPAHAESASVARNLTNSGMTPIPYFPGQESMSLGMATVRAEVDDRGAVQPIAEGAEAYYSYALGDSMTWTLPGGRVVRLRELVVRPRAATWNTVVGSLWFDVESAQLVRAAYRLAVPRDVWANIDQQQRDRGTRENPLLMKLMKAIVSPFRVEISAVVVEYGLYDGRFWLPRSRSLQGSQQVSFARMPIEFEQAFSYSSINAPLSLADVVLNEPDRNPLIDPDSLRGEALQKWRDSAISARRERRRAFADSLDAAPCDTSGYRVLGRLRTDLPVAVKYPCEVAKLTKSEDFAKPLYDANEELFGTKQRDALLNDALPFGAQALIKLGALPKPTFQYGLSMTRYNRIEGLSTGVFVEQQLGAGYVVGTTGRFGFADREPNVELSIARTNLRQTLALRGYNRLVTANDWGNPLSFGSSMSALLFGRDDGFYYRASGAELRWTSERGMKLDWRLFGEQQRTATQRTNYSMRGSFEPNIVATTGLSAGGGLRWTHSYGLDPRGFRSFADFRAEAAGGDSVYGRGAFDVTFSTGLPGDLATSLSLAAGASVGHVPPQRLWYLGGTHTIRGQSPDTAQSGNAFWMTRGEIGPRFYGYRLMMFGDLGWVGDQSAFTVRTPMSGAGIGLSMMDGMVRFDLARGLYPRKQTRFAGYFEVRF